MKSSGNCGCQCCDHGLTDMKLPYIEQAVKYALSKSNMTILWIAPNMDKARTSLRRAKELGFGKVNLTRAEIQFTNGSKIYFASDNNPDKLRGLRLDSAFIEEKINVKAQEIIQLALITHRR